MHHLGILMTQTSQLCTLVIDKQVLLTENIGPGLLSKQMLVTSGGGGERVGEGGGREGQGGGRGLDDEEEEDKEDEMDEEEETRMRRTKIY